MAEFKQILLLLQKIALLERASVRKDWVSGTEPIFFFLYTSRVYIQSNNNIVSRVAQRKRAGLITQRTEDRNLPLLFFFSVECQADRVSGRSSVRQIECQTDRASDMSSVRNRYHKGFLVNMSNTNTVPSLDYQQGGAVEACWTQRVQRSGDRNLSLLSVVFRTTVFLPEERSSVRQVECQKIECQKIECQKIECQKIECQKIECQTDRVSDRSSVRRSSVRTRYHNIFLLNTPTTTTIQ